LNYENNYVKAQIIARASKSLQIFAHYF